MKICKSYHSYPSIILVGVLFSCGHLNSNVTVNEVQENSIQSVPDNIELVTLYEEDQSDRKSNTINWDAVSYRDSNRQRRVLELLDSNKIVTAVDHYNGAMIFQHGTDTIASTLAVKLMKKAVQLDSTINKWLLAAAIDRDLMRRGQPQIYGTQFVRKNSDTAWQLYEMDSTKITDEERVEYGVEPISELKNKIKKLNAKKH